MSGPNPIVIDFVCKNVDKVQAALRGIAATVAQTEATSTAAQRRGASERLTTAEKAAKAQVAAWQRSDAMVAAAQRAGTREAEKRFRAETAAAAKSATERIALAKRIAAEERRAKAEALKASPMAAKLATAPTSPRARLALLEKVKGASPAEQRAALDQVAGLKAEHGAHVYNARAESRASEQAAKDKVRAMVRADREVARARAAGEREADRSARDSVRAFERSEKEKARIAAREARARAAEQRRVDAEVQRRREAFARTVTNAGGTAVRNATSIVGATARGIVGGAMQVGGGFSLADSVQRRVQMRGNLADISNRAVIKGDKENEKRVSVDELQGQVQSVGMRYAIDPEKATAALDKFASKTGNLARGRQLLSGLAEMSRAGAGNLDDLADAAGDVFNTDSTADAEKVLAIMRALSAQGKLGAVEMKDLASQLAKLGAAAGQFQGDSGKNMATMGALAQLARASGGAAGPQQATTAVQSLTAQLYKGARLKGFADLGVQVKDEKSGLNRDLDSILIETLQATERKSREGGHGMRDFDVVLGKAFADVQAKRAVNPLAKAYKEAGGGEAGAKAARDLLQKFAGATMSKEEVAAAAAERMKETDAQLEQAMQALRKTTADELTPALVRLVPIIQGLVPPMARLLNGMVRLAEFFEANPFTGLGALVMGLFVKEIAAAQISSTIQRMITGAMGGGVPGVGGAAGGAAGGAGTAATGGAAQAGLIGAGVAMQVGLATDLADRHYGAIKSGDERAAQIRKDLESGEPGKRAVAMQAIAKAREQSSTTRTIEANADNATRALGIAFNPLSVVGMKVADYAAEKAGIQTTNQRTTETTAAKQIVSDAALLKLAEAIERNTSATTANTSKAPAEPASPGPASPGAPQRNGPIGRRPGG